ncbi:N-acetyltransferase [Verrucomicrobiota bacterium]|nr:N-acetyltransferase [Verrucomicrobiota bacterium]
MHILEPLAKSHDREGFDCGSQPLNLFLRHTARQHGERGISRTFVLVEENAAPPKPILGYFALNLCQIKAESLTPDEARKLPRDVAGVRLGRLAVATTFQRQGLGKTLLIAAMEKFLEIFHSAGGIGLFVDAKDEAAAHSDEQFGFVRLPSNRLELFLPVRTIQTALASPHG